MSDSARADAWGAPLGHRLPGARRMPPFVKGVAMRWAPPKHGAAREVELPCGLDVRTHATASGRTWCLCPRDPSHGQEATPCAGHDMSQLDWCEAYVYVIKACNYRS